MNFWLFKSEPDVWGWSHQVARGAAGEEWHGVRNYAARNNMRLMEIDDLGFFYHSNTGKEIVGIVDVCRKSEHDSTTDDPRWDCVMIRAVKPLLRPVTLQDCKLLPGLEKMILINNSRLSVQPVSPEEWRIICNLGGIAP